MKCVPRCSDPQRHAAPGHGDPSPRSPHREAQHPTKQKISIKTKRPFPDHFTYPGIALLLLGIKHILEQHKLRRRSSNLSRRHTTRRRSINSDRANGRHMRLNFTIAIKVGHKLGARDRVQADARGVIVKGRSRAGVTSKQVMGEVVYGRGASPTCLT